jgi:hypothetical protein
MNCSGKGHQTIYGFTKLTTSAESLNKVAHIGRKRSKYGFKSKAWLLKVKPVLSFQAR